MFNLPASEQKVLDAFIEKGTLTTGDITKLTGVSRPNCYDVLNRLIEKGLITKLKENKLVKYSINKLDYNTLLKAKTKELDELKQNVSNYNKRIEELKKKNSNHEIEIYSGKKGLAKFFSQTFDTSTLSVFGAEGALEEKYPDIWRTWIRKLRENNIRFRVIYNEENRKLREHTKIPIINSRFIERNSKTNVTTQVMDSQVNLLHWEEIPLVISIKSTDIAKAYKEEFEFMWKSSTK